MSSLQSRNVQTWIPEAERRGATHLLDVCDTFDYEHYPVYVMPDDDLKEKVSHYNENMQSVYGTYEVKETV